MFRMLRGIDKIYVGNCFNVDTNVNQTRGHPLKVVRKCVKTNIRKYFFSNRVVNCWNSLPSKAIQTVATFKKHLDDFFDVCNVA